MVTRNRRTVDSNRVVVSATERDRPARWKVTDLHFIAPKHYEFVARG
jgi:hypothetical protein